MKPSTRLNILIDSCSCNPTVGSNAEAGYGFATEALKRNNVFLLSHKDLFLEGANPLADATKKNLSLHLIKPSVFGKLGRQSDFLVQSYFAAKRIIKRSNPDVIHTVEPMQYLITRPLALLPKTPFIVGPLNGGNAYPPKTFLHSLEEMRLQNFSSKASLPKGLKRIAHVINEQLLYGSIAKASTSMAFKRASKIIIGTKNCLNSIPSVYHNKCVSIPCFGINTTQFTPLSGHKKECPVILYAGRITAWKGLDLLIASFAQKNIAHNALLRIAGSGQGNINDERFELYCKELVKKLNISDSVDFCGHVSREGLLKHYQTCDIFCMTSLWEPFGLVYLEAMACGKPVIAMASGGPLEIITPDVGYAIAPVSAKQFTCETADVLSELLHNESKRQSLGIAARECILKNYSWEVIGEKMQRVYESVI